MKKENEPKNEMNRADEDSPAEKRAREIVNAATESLRAWANEDIGHRAIIVIAADLDLSLTDEGSLKRTKRDTDCCFSLTHGNNGVGGAAIEATMQSDRPMVRIAKYLMKCRGEN